MQHMQNARCKSVSYCSTFFASNSNPNDLAKWRVFSLVQCVFRFLVVTIGWAAALCIGARAAEPLAAWLQLGASAEARALVSGNICPTVFRDGVAQSMAVRAEATVDFPLLCSAPVPRGTQSLLLDGKPLPVPVENPRRILVLGDTGCRVDGSEMQACNDPSAWVFPQEAVAAAALQPDLIIHLGDYVSREGACRARFTGCAGTPFGDNWPAWQADLFEPAAPLFAAAPIVFTRGNHEDCNREGLGWLRLMGQGAFDPFQACPAHSAPVIISLGTVTLGIVDTASAPDTELKQDMAQAYAADLQSLASLPAPVWLVQHRPDFGAIAGPMGIPIGGNETLISGMWTTSIPGNVDLMLSGHIHGFEAMNYYSGVPPQIIGGNGGDLLHNIPRLLKGAIFQGGLGVAVKDGVSDTGFGFLMLTKTDDGWNIDTYDWRGAAKRHCQLMERRITCAG